MLSDGGVTTFQTPRYVCCYIEISSSAGRSFATRDLALDVRPTCEVFTKIPNTIRSSLPMARSEDRLKGQNPIFLIILRSCANVRTT